MSTEPRIARVVWEDACAVDSQVWADREDPPAKYEPRMFTSVGYLLYDGPEGIIMSDTWGDDQIGPRHQIPRGMLREIVDLTPMPVHTIVPAKKGRSRA